MRSLPILLLPLFAVGCATHRPVAVQSPPPVALAAVSPTKAVETRYDVRSYQEAANPAIRHEAHAVYRRTRVPDSASGDFETVPRSAFAPASVVPLPASEELTAELSTQKAITADIRAMQASMVATESRMQAQYAQLVRQSAEALKLREQLEAERNHSRVASNAATPVSGTAVNPSEVKW